MDLVRTGDADEQPDEDSEEREKRQTRLEVVGHFASRLQETQWQCKEVI